MDQTIATLATTVMGVLLPYVTRGAKEFATIAGDAAFEKAKALMETLKKRWSGDPEAAQTVERFEQKPERYEPVMKDILEEKLTADPALAQDVKTQIDAMGPELAIIQRLKDVDTVTGLDVREMNRGKASVTQDIERGRNITGAKIDKLG